MITGITHVSVLVDDYDEALQWYVEKLGLEPRMDGVIGEGYRFVTVGVRGQSIEMVLHKLFGDRSAREVIEAGEGVQPAVVFSSDSCRSDTQELRSRGVTIKQGQRTFPGVSRRYSRTRMETHTSSWSLRTQASRAGRGSI